MNFVDVGLFLFAAANGARLCGQDATNFSAKFSTKAPTAWRKLQSEYAKGVAAIVEFSGDDGEPLVAVAKIGDDAELALVYRDADVGLGRLVDVARGDLTRRVPKGNRGAPTFARLRSVDTAGRSIDARRLLGGDSRYYGGKFLARVE